MTKTPTDIVVDLFGGLRPLARLLDVDPSSIIQWRKPRETREAGLIPSTHHKILLEEAKKRGYKLTPTDLIYGRK